MMYVLIGLFLTIIFLILFMVYQAHHDTINNCIIYDKRLPSAFHGFRVFFISDIHRRKIKQHTLNLINEQMDIVIIGGDLTEKGVPLERTKNNLAKLKQWNVPILFIWGNNDYETNVNELSELLKKEKVTILANNNMEFKKDGSVLSILGLDCYKYQEPRLDIALANTTGDYYLLVTHDPSAFYELDTLSQKSLHTVLAGHTHGGQIRIFGFGFYKNGGLSKHKNTNVFISEGYGYTQLPFRLGTKAECHVLSFENQAVSQKA